MKTLTYGCEDANKAYVNNDIQSTETLSYNAEINRIRDAVWKNGSEVGKIVVGGDIFDVLINKVDIARYGLLYSPPDVEITAKMLFPWSQKKPSVTRTYANGVPRIKNVIFNEPATIVFWEDGTKTVVKCDPEYDFYDPEKGITMAIVKKMYGNKGNYFNEIKKWTKEYYEKETEVGEQDKFELKLNYPTPEQLNLDLEILKKALGIKLPSEGEEITK